MPRSANPVGKGHRVLSLETDIKDRDIEGIVLQVPEHLLERSGG